MENGKNRAINKKTAILINFDIINNHIVQIIERYKKIMVLKTQDM